MSEHPTATKNQSATTSPEPSRSGKEAGGTISTEYVPLNKLLNENESGEWAQMVETGIRDGNYDETIDQYSEEMENGTRFPPVTLFRDGDKFFIADGFHRICAAEKSGAVHIEAVVHKGNRLDAIWHALAANKAHGLRMTANDKRIAVLIALREFPERSLREIAERIGCSHEFVRKLKPEVSTVDTCAKVTGKDGKVYPAKMPKSETYIAPEVQEEKRINHTDVSDTSFDQNLSCFVEVQTDPLSGKVKAPDIKPEEDMKSEPPNLAGLKRYWNWANKKEKQCFLNWIQKGEG